jgi:hypothetical protein
MGREGLGLPGAGRGKLPGLDGANGAIGLAIWGRGVGGGVPAGAGLSPLMARRG